MKHRVTFIFLLFLFNIGITKGQKPFPTEKIDRFLQTMLAKSNVPGFAVAVVDRDSVLLSKGYGVTSNGKPVNAKTPFAIASLSKAFTALSIMQLVSTNKLDLDKKVETCLPSLHFDDRRASGITVGQLLHQTSGLNDEVFPELSFYQQPASLDEAITRLKRVKLGSAPGEKFRYHNPNYQVLAKVMESVAGEPFPIYLKKHVFNPLGMDQTVDVFSTTSFDSTSKEFANGHIFFLGKPVHIQEPDWFVDGAAGMVSNAGDMAKWLKLQLNYGAVNGKTLLDSVNLKKMQTAAAPSPYGMGWFVNRDNTLSHSGILWTYSAEQMITANGCGIVILFNGGINAFQDYHAFIQGVADILNNKEPEIPALPGWTYPVGTCLMMILLASLSVKSLFQLNQWRQKSIRYPARRRWVYLLTSTLPILLFFCIPYLLFLLSGRVLNWQRIFLMAPDVMIGLGLIVLLRIVTVGARIFLLVKMKGLR